MSDRQNKKPLMLFLSHLRERKMVQWAAVYAAGAWLLIQIADTIGPRWGLTENLARAIDVIAVLGFVATLIIAWYHGEKGRQRVGTFEFLMLGALLVIGGAAMELVKDRDDQAPGIPVNTPSDTAKTTAVSAPERRMTVAVLPFDNFSPNPDDAYFASGITEEITSQLAQIGDLTVLSRVAVERAISSEGSLDDIARSLGAGSVLEGSVRMAGDQVRITAQLIDMSNHQHLWAESFDRQLTDIFRIQTDVALAIGGALLAQLSGSERRRIEKSPTDNIKAYQLYLKSNELFGSRPDQNAEAIGLLEQALELDPDFAEARAKLAWRYVWSHRSLGNSELARQAERIALQALETDPNLAIGYYALGSAYGEQGRAEPTMEAFRHAYELDPNDLSVLLDGSQLEARSGSIVTALKMAYRAVQLDPNSANTRWHAFLPLFFMGDEPRMADWLDLAAADGLAMHRLDISRVHLKLVQGNIERAVELANEVRAQHREIPEAQNWIAALLFVAGEWQSVKDELLEAASARPNVLSGYFSMPRSLRTLAAFIKAESGQGDEAQALFEESLAVNDAMSAQGNTSFHRRVETAAIHAYLGEADEAVAALEQAMATGYAADFALRIDPMFASLREDRRFQALLGKMAEIKRQKRAEAASAGVLEGYDRLMRERP